VGGKNCCGVLLLCPKIMPRNYPIPAKPPFGRLFIMIPENTLDSFTIQWLKHARLISPLVFYSTERRMRDFWLAYKAKTSFFILNQKGRKAFLTLPTPRS
jgi:hypothetical protein